jgi:hypothetical protein
MMSGPPPDYRAVTAPDIAGVDEPEDTGVESAFGLAGLALELTSQVDEVHPADDVEPRALGEGRRARGQMPEPRGQPPGGRGAPEKVRRSTSVMDFSLQFVRLIRTHRSS